MMAWKELYNHRPDDALAQRMIDLRSHYIGLGEIILKELPEGRSKSLAKTHLEESLMRAIQSLALLGECMPVNH